MISALYCGFPKINLLIPRAWHSTSRTRVGRSKASIARKQFYRRWSRTGMYVDKSVKLLTTLDEAFTRKGHAAVLKNAKRLRTALSTALYLLLLRIRLANPSTSSPFRLRPPAISRSTLSTIIAGLNDLGLPINSKSMNV